MLRLLTHRLHPSTLFSLTPALTFRNGFARLAKRPLKPKVAAVLSSSDKLKLYERLKKKQLKKREKISSEQLEEHYKYYRCDGCNSTLQSDDNRKFGYIDQQVLNRSLVQNREAIASSYGAKAHGQDAEVVGLLHEVEQELQVPIFDPKLPDLQNMDRVDVLLRLQDKIDNFEQEQQTVRRSRNFRKEILCVRCYSLKNHQRLPAEYDVPEEAGSQEAVLDKVFAKHRYKPAYFLYVVDVLDLCGSFQKAVFLRLLRQKSRFMIVANKSDIINAKYLRRDLLVSALRQMMYEFICEEGTEEVYHGFEKSHIVEVKVVLACSLSKNGVKRIDDHLDQLEVSRIQILGYPNSGKTTLLNQLAQLNKPTSKIPGTTVYITEHYDLKKRLFFDMPGLPCLHNLCNLVDRPNLRALLTWNKLYSPPLLTHHAFFYGGKVEIPGVRIVLFGLGGACSSDNTWFLNNRAQFWKGLPEPHLLDITRYEQDLAFVNGRTQDLEIAGYGFMSFRLCEQRAPPQTRKLVFYLPARVQFRFRDSILRDSELLHFKTAQTKRHMLQRVHSEKQEKLLSETNRAKKKKVQSEKQ